MFHVLIVDDEYYICESLKSHLTQLADPQIGDIKTCQSGEEALVLCQTFKPQIVFTDIQMKGMDGISLLHALNQVLHPVQFVVLSGFDDFCYVRGAFQNGAVDYLLKPIRSEDLSEIIARVSANLRGSSQNPDRLRRTLFQLSADLFHELSHLPANKPLPQALLNKLDSAGIAGTCCCAVIAPISPKGSDDRIRQINLIYDSFDQILGYPITGNKIGILCDGSRRDAFARFLTEFILSGQEPLAAGLTASVPVCQAHLLLRKAEELLCLRLFHGHGKLFTEADVTGSQKFTPRLKHLMTQFIKTPALITTPAQYTAFSRELRRLSLPALLRFYPFFHEMLGAALSDSGSSSPEYEIPSLCDFPQFDSLEQYFCQRLNTYARINSAAVELPGSLDMVKEYVNTHYNENLTLASLAERFFLSYSYLSKSFHKAFHMPFQQYLLMLRMEHALELLKNPDLTISQIAERVGYENAFNFSRAFKARYGVSPSHFRSHSGHPH